MTRILDRLETALRLLTALLIILLVTVLCEQVVHRYAFGGSWPLMGYLVPLFFVWASMLGSAIGVRRGVHFSADMLTVLLPARPRLVFRYVQLAMMGLVALILVWTGIDFVRLGAAKSDPFTGYSMALTYAALPVGGLLMLVFTLELATRRGEALLDETLQAET